MRGNTKFLEYKFKYKSISWESTVFKFDTLHLVRESFPFF